mmetsp:Transcript_19558/g.48166  ORF Transcript_19558/g.48166 Transcript_19558/m.48166 type:complete len:623 (+) Transcript_19558:118-1986(+)
MDSKNNNGEDGHENEGQQEPNDDSSPRKDQAPSSPRPQPTAAVDMTGSVRSPNTMKSSNKREEDETLLKQRFRNSNFADTSEMGFSRQSQNSTLDDMVSAELMIQRIHDQRSKDSAVSSQQPAARVPASITHQVSSGSSNKPPRPQSSNSSALNPGAYSVGVSGTARDRDDDGGHGNEYESSIMQLEAVPVDETFEQTKMKEMEEQMNREIERRLSLERKITTKPTHHNQSCLKERVPIVLAALVLISGVTAGLYLLLAPNVAPEAEASTQFIHPPPTTEDCEAVRSGATVPNRDNYPSVMMETVIDVSYDAALAADSVDSVILEVQEKYDSFFVPILNGCNDLSQEYFNRTFSENRYIVADGDVLNVTRSATDCEADEPRPCVRAVIQYILWTKAEFSAFDLVSMMDTNFGTALLQSISDDSDIIQHTSLVSIGSSAPKSDPEINVDYDFEFPPPTEERCEAVYSGTAVTNQDSYFTMLADAVMDVSTHVPWEDSLDEVLLEIGNQFQTIVIPTLAGCMDTAETLLNSTVTASRYILVNSFVLNVTKAENVECDAEEPRPCLRVVVHSRIWLMKEAPIFELIIAADQNYGPALWGKIGSQDDKENIIKQADIVIFSPPLGG